MTASRAAGPLVERTARLLASGPAVVLTGAGCSTASGIPDYRGPDGSLRGRSPMTWQEFVRDPEARARYWSRSAVGWTRIRDAAPNPAHVSLARLEAAGVVGGVITQNVDGLHQAAGSRRVLELHGSLARVRCLGCDLLHPRDRVQAWIEELNPGFALRDPVVAPGMEGTLGEPDRPADPRALPDGDAELPREAASHFQVPGCPECGGVLKPDVVFFGESVPPERVDRAWALYEASASLLVVGSSLAVYSGRRFLLRARREGRPVVLLTLGRTRCDEEVTFKVDDRVERFLPRLVRTLGAADAALA